MPVNRREVVLLQVGVALTKVVVAMKQMSRKWRRVATREYEIVLSVDMRTFFMGVFAP